MPKYYSVKSGALVTRYGTGTYIGARIEMTGGVVGVVFDEAEVAEISDVELARYSREYAGLVAEGSLVAKKAADHQAWCKSQADASTAEAAPAEAAPAEAAAPSKKADR